MLKFYKVNDRIIINDATSGTELIPNTVDAAYEKHVPVIEHSGDHRPVRKIHQEPPGTEHCSGQSSLQILRPHLLP